jgi:hypothetical protein
LKLLIKNEVNFHNFGKNYILASFMKKAIFTRFALLMILFPIKANEQYILIGIANNQYKDTVPCIDPSAKCYWFYVSPKFDKKSDIVKIRVLSKTPKSGSISVYEKDVWRNLQNGDQIVIGPFNSSKDAQNSILLYEIAFHQSDLTIYSFENELYWFKLKLARTPKTRRLIFFEPNYEVFKGNSNEFILDLKNSIQENLLVIGPWIDKIFFETVKPKPNR